MENTKSEQDTRRNRTLLQARDAGALPVSAKTLAVPMHRRYRDAFSVVPSKDACLLAVRPDIADLMECRDGQPFLDGRPAPRTDLPVYRDIRPDALAEVDVPTIYLAYSLVHDSLRDVATRPYEIDEAIEDPGFCGRSLKYYVPELLQAMGSRPSGNDQNVKAFVDRFRSCRNVIGLVPTMMGPECYPALTLLDYDAGRNMIEFSSPYLHKIALRARRDSIQLDRSSQPKLQYNGEPFMKPSHSRLIGTDILRERNRRAIMAVHAVVSVIEQAGINMPHITAQSIVDRCPGLRDALRAADPASRNKTLSRLFGKTWELLRTHTSLTDAYKDIRIPDRVPTSSRLDMVFEFSHKGRTAGTMVDHD